jgi:hypothetical protein
MRSMLVVALLSGTAFADDVNLLVSTPTTVAVSSTVANAAILPDHLVDGKLSTAWNSQTGELAGAWISVRLPADARVTSVKLTAGFTHKDKRFGDLFTQNPRIKKVRISQGGRVLAEKALDVENRGLQTIPVAIAGGDFEVRVIDVVPGKKKNWRETCVSELEVWGSVPKVVKSKPSVRIRSLDAPATLTREQCIKAVGKVDGKVTNVEAIPLSDDHVICRVDHKVKGSTETTSEIAAVKRAGAVLIEKVSETFTIEDRKSEGTGDTGSVQLVVFPLRTFEKGLLVHTSQSKYGPMMDVGKTESKLYRVTQTALEELVAYESTWDDGESTESDRCELAPVELRKTMQNLVIECVNERGHWHDENPDDRGVDTKERKQTFRWRNEKYEER